MRTRGDFWDDATENFVLVDLGMDDVAQDTLAVFNDRCGRFIAGAFDA
jgi:hypothetical protein